MLAHRKAWALSAVAALAIVCGLLAAAPLGVRAQDAPPLQPTQPGNAENRRELPVGVASPDISFIDSPSATCYRVSVATCYVTWDYLSVTAATSSYVISMTITLNDQLRAYHAGFFQNQMYIPWGMYGPGFKVPCGWPGVSGNPALGYAYPYTIRAAESGGLTAANYGTAICPANPGTVFLPLTLR